MSRKGKFWLVFMIIGMVLSLLGIFTNWTGQVLNDIGLAMLVIVLVRAMIISIKMKRENREIS